MTHDVDETELTRCALLGGVKNFHVDIPIIAGHIIGSGNGGGLHVIDGWDCCNNTQLGNLGVWQCCSRRGNFAGR